MIRFMEALSVMVLQLPRKIKDLRFQLLPSLVFLGCLISFSLFTYLNCTIHFMQATSVMALQLPGMLQCFRCMSGLRHSYWEVCVFRYNMDLP